MTLVYVFPDDLINGLNNFLMKLIEKSYLYPSLLRNFEEREEYLFALHASSRHEKNIHSKVEKKLGLDHCLKKAL
jgi:hypothetical protein